MTNSVAVAKPKDVATVAVSGVVRMTGRDMSARGGRRVLFSLARRDTTPIYGDELSDYGALTFSGGGSQSD